MAAPMFPGNTHRFDAYRGFKFQVVIGGKTVAGMSKMGALKKTTEVVNWRAAGDPSYQRALPGGTKFENVTLEQGLSHDPVFEEWANAVNNVSEGDAGMSLVNFRRDVVVTLMNLQGQPAIAYKLQRAWVAEYQAMPELDANNMNTVAIQTLTVAYEGLVRDLQVVEPTET